ncbi:hypothetical protein SBOR_6285 [Sclerotinia borealis F-4128]|uniref:GED domain-containing protein n=1 Tax=Sclerotinia borealis (strain F-4128) TaxID=1432307 RepID=W9C9B8_SCLBF|nr:hypothetical protein SBOR_6285 [Sclerotinia borealis F-4128]
MASRITRKQKEEVTPTHAQLTSPTRTKLPTSPFTIKQEALHRSIAQSSQGAKEYHSSSNPHYQIDADRGTRHYKGASHHPASNPVEDEEPDSRNTTPSLDSMEGFVRIGKEQQKLIEALSELADYDVEHVVDLSKIVVIGDQSVGKSSLIGRVTGMTLPKNSGCCTRCPANIITKAADVWSCTISLRQGYGYRSIPVKDRDVTKDNPFPPWYPQELVVKEFIRITDKTKLEEAMKWAQIALLNHNQYYEQFIPGSGSHFINNIDHTQADATPNIVKVEISGPGLPTLSLFDLPGIIANSATSDTRYLIKFFDNIAKKYIRTPNTLIIFVMTMQVEAVLSKSKSLIEEERATDRCMGVLTKPDTLVEKHGTNDWEKILSGQEHLLGHGWHVTRQPGQDFQPGDVDYHLQARKDEEEFFKTNELWQGKWFKFQNLCGIPRIQMLLSCLLAQSINKSLPDIKIRIARRKNIIVEELKGLPELPNHNVQLHVSRLLHNFSQGVKKVMGSEGNRSDTTFHGEWTKISRLFHQLILHNKPNITVSDASDVLKVQVINLDVDDTDDRFEPVPGRSVEHVPIPRLVADSNRKRTHEQIATDETAFASGVNQTPFTPSKFKSETPNSPHTPRPMAQSHGNPFRNTIFECHAHYGKRFASIGDIRRKIENHTYMGLPDMVNTPVYQHFCEKAVSDWQSPTHILLKGVISLLRSEIENIVEKILGPYQQTGLYRESIAIIQKWIDEELFKTQRDALDELYMLETYSPFTMDQEGIQKRKEIEKLDLQEKRRKVRAIRFVEKEIYCGSKRMKAKPAEKEAYLQEKKKLVDQVTVEQLGKDAFQNEIDVAAYIRGYYVVAANRYIDYVCISINNRLFRYIKENIEDFLENQLGTNDVVTGIAKCQELMEENDEVGARRRKLQTELKALEEFEVRFQQLLNDITHPRDDDESTATVTAAIQEETETDRSETGDFEQPRYRQQSPIEEMQNKRRNTYNSSEEAIQALKRGEDYVNGSDQCGEV